MTTRRFITAGTCIGAALAATLAAGCAGAPKRTLDPADTALAPAGGTGAKPVPDIRIAGVERTSAALSALRALRDQLSSNKSQVDTTLAALSEVTTGQGDLVPSLKRFTVAVADAKAAEQKSVEKTDEMRAQARDYITNWEVEVYGVDDPELRRQAETRRNQVRSNYGRVNEAMKATRSAYGRFETSLTDIKHFLDNDLTRNGVAAAAGSAAKTNEAGQELKRQIDVAVAELDRVSGEMTSAGPSAATPPTRQ